MSRSPSSSQASSNRKYAITDKDRAKLSSGLLIAFNNEAMRIKKMDETIVMYIPYIVYYNEQRAPLDYENMLDWCFQRTIGVTHISIFMNRHWMLAVISPWNGFVFWHDPAGTVNDIREFSQRIINEGIIKWCAHRKDKKIIRNPTIVWKKPQCPRQSQDTNDSGYFVCRYMHEITARRQVISDKYGPEIYSQELIDEIRDSWISYVFKEKNDINEDEDDDDINVDGYMLVMKHLLILMV